MFLVEFKKKSASKYRKCKQMATVTEIWSSKPKCTRFDFSWGFAPDPAGGAHSAPQEL